MNILEDYCDFEIAKLLKEKGFDEKCRAYYKVFPESRIAAIYYSSENRGVSEDDPNEILCPTLQMAMKWFLKKYNIFICVLFLEESGGYGYTIENIIKKKYITTSKNSSYKEPEEACEAAIKYCLENLLTPTVNK